MVPRKRDSKAVRILTFLFIMSLIANGLQYAFNKHLKDNNDVYTKEIKHNFEQRELGYKIRIDNLSRIANKMEHSADSIAAVHRDHVRQDSILIADLKNVKGKFNDLTAEQVRNKMIEEYEKQR